MDRLTDRTRNHGIYLTGQNMGATGYVPDDVLKRLAAYEDTGLTPEEITNLHYDHQEFRRYVAENARLRAERDKAVEDLKQFGQCGACAKFYRVDGCGANAHSYCDGGFKWRGPQEAGGGSD